MLGHLRLRHLYVVEQYARCGHRRQKSFAFQAQAMQILHFKIAQQHLTACIGIELPRVQARGFVGKAAQVHIIAIGKQNLRRIQAPQHMV